MKFDSALLISGAILTAGSLQSDQGGFAILGMALMCVAIFAHYFPSLQKIWVAPANKSGEATSDDSGSKDGGRGRGL